MPDDTTSKPDKTCKVRLGHTLSIVVGGGFNVPAG